MGVRFPRSERWGRPLAVILTGSLVAVCSTFAPAGATAPSPGVTLLAVRPIPAPTLHAEVRPEQVAANDVVVEAAASLPAGDQARLEETAARLRTEGVPTKFAVVATRPADTPAGEYARQLRQAAGFDGNLLVLFLSPGSLGLASTRVSDADLDAAFAAERSSLAADPVGGTIAVADRLAQSATPSATLDSEVRPAPASPLAPRDVDTGNNAVGNVAGGLLVAGLLGAIVFGVRRARRQRDRRFDERRAAMEPMVDAVANEVDELWQRISEGGEQADAAHGPWDEAAQAQLAGREKLRRASGEADLSA
ncbi:MAG: hypothetical protein ACRD0O_20745, partial [Acidimicrobiia bacterium]